ncbi:hypothetical protein KPL70_003507 [Citrus sinensis]|nr:hypothetical protein KPL70_003507 [Citrus sinensis]
MAIQNDSTFRKGQSTTRPPYFDGNDYPYWKIRMRIYLQALNYEIWEIVNDGPFMPLTKNEVGKDIPKPSRDWNEFKKRKASLNSKAMNVLFCALDKKEFHRVSSCESANEIWHKLEIWQLKKGHEEKKKNIALKASKRESDEESEMDDEELAMLARRFRKFYKKNNEQRKFRGYKNKKEKKEPITCYECKKPGHIRPECPLLNKLKKKAMAEAVNTACYVLNQVLIKHNLNKTPYELWKDRKPNIGYFKVFGCKCFVLNTKDNLGQFDPKSDVGIFLGYSNSSKAYRVYNKRTLVLEESMHVTFDETNPSSTEKVIVDDNAEEEQQEEASNDNQEDAPPGIQEDHHEEPNVE